MISFVKGLAAAVLVLTGLSPAGHGPAVKYPTIRVVTVATAIAGPDLDNGVLLGNRLLVSPPPPPPAPAPVAIPAPAPAIVAEPEPAPIEPAPAAVPTAPVAVVPAWQPPAPPPPAPPAPPAIVIGSGQQALINQDRAAAGLGPLTWNGCLAAIAGQNAQRMAAQGAISHAGGPSADLGCGLGNTAGENVGYWSGGINDGQLNTMFMNSPGHRANIMGNYRYVGTAWAVAPNGYAYIAVEFG